LGTTGAGLLFADDLHSFPGRQRSAAGFAGRPERLVVRIFFFSLFSVILIRL
jgi:hypothetical protein